MPNGNPLLSRLHMAAAAACLALTLAAPSAHAADVLDV